MFTGPHEFDEFFIIKPLPKDALNIIYDSKVTVYLVFQHGFVSFFIKRAEVYQLIGHPLGHVFKEAGLSVMHYEGSQPGDRTDLDEKRFLDQLDAWMESLGFRKLED